MTQTVALRSLAVTDAKAMMCVLADPVLYEYTGGEPPSLAELEEQYLIQVRGRSADYTQEWLNPSSNVDLGASRSATSKQRFPSQEGRQRSPGSSVHPGKGAGMPRRAVRLLLRLLEARGVHDVMAHIHPSHEASQSVARKVGFIPTQVVVAGEVRWLRPSQPRDVSE